MTDVYSKSVVKIQIKMITATVLSLAVYIASKLNPLFLANIVGRIFQFFYWAFRSVFFKGNFGDTTPSVLYEQIYSSEFLRSPLCFMELIILFSFIALFSCPVELLLEKLGKDKYSHFYGLYVLLSCLVPIPQIATAFITAYGKYIYMNFVVYGLILIFTALIGICRVVRKYRIKQVLMKIAKEETVVLEAYFGVILFFVSIPVIILSLMNDRTVIVERRYYGN